MVHFCSRIFRLVGAQCLLVLKSEDTHETTVEERGKDPILAVRSWWSGYSYVGAGLGRSLVLGGAHKMCRCSARLLLKRPLLYAFSRARVLG